MMYVNLHLQGLGGFANSSYWSSTELDGNDAWAQFFNFGYQSYNISAPQAVCVLFGLFNYLSI